MSFETKCTWEKLGLEVGLIKSNESNNVFPMCVALQTLLQNTQTNEATLLKFKELGIELKLATQSLDESERLTYLNNFFFNEQNFQVASLNLDDLDIRHYCFEQILNYKKGSLISLSLMYIYFAQTMDLPVFHVSFEFPRMLKWVRSKKAVFLDVLNLGTELTERVVLEKINQLLSNGLTPDLFKMDILSSKQVFQHYLEELERHFNHTRHLRNRLSVVNLLVDLENSNLNYLHKRIVLYRQLGHIKESMNDIKRYFSFTDKCKAPNEIKMIFYELQAINSEEKVSPLTEYLH